MSNLTLTASPGFCPVSVPRKQWQERHLGGWHSQQMGVASPICRKEQSCHPWSLQNRLRYLKLPFWKYFDRSSHSFCSRDSEFQGGCSTCLPACCLWVQRSQSCVCYFRRKLHKRLRLITWQIRGTHLASLRDLSPHNKMSSKEFVNWPKITMQRVDPKYPQTRAINKPELWLFNCSPRRGAGATKSGDSFVG